LSLALGGLISIIAFRRLAAPAGQNCPAQKDELTTLLASSRITLRS